MGKSFDMSRQKGRAEAGCLLQLIPSHVVGDRELIATPSLHRSKTMQTLHCASLLANTASTHHVLYTTGSFPPTHTTGLSIVNLSHLPISNTIIAHSVYSYPILVRPKTSMSLAGAMTCKIEFGHAVFQLNSTNTQKGGWGP